MHAVASAPVRFAPIARAVPAHRCRTSAAVKPGVPPRRASSIATRASSPKNASQEINAAKLSVLVDDLRAASGDANGTDLTEEDRSEVESILSVIESLCPTDNCAEVHVDGTLAGTDWELIYTDSSGNSSGKIGPFVGKVKQVFKPANGGCPGTYTNVVELFGGVFTVIGLVEAIIHHVSSSLLKKQI